MRAELLNEIDHARQMLGIPDADFRPLPYTTNWHKLQETIYQRFCRFTDNSKSVWLWERFKLGYQGLALNGWPADFLHHLVPPAELLLFMAYNGNHFFFYEGKINAIQRILEEVTGELDEYYLIDKKYEWLICLNHHDTLIGTGDYAIQQLRTFAHLFPELVTQAYPA